MGERTSLGRASQRGSSHLNIVARVATILGLVASILLLAAPSASAQAGTSSVILNEWNAVASDEVLADGSVDPAFGLVLGNGGNWFEMVVADPNGVDIRGWRLEISDSDNVFGSQAVTDTLIVTQDPALANIPAGTIITVAEDVPDDFDASDFHINLQSNDADEGAGFTAASQQDFDTNSKTWQLRIRTAIGAVIFGNAGEGIAPVSGVGNTEIGKLEADPSTAITPQSPYNDGTTSTFGAPNVWSSGTMVQDFSVLRGGQSTPTASLVQTCENSDGRIDFTLTNPTAAAVSYVLAVGGASGTTVSVPAGTSTVESISGIADGSRNVTVSADGQQIFNEQLSFACDPQVGTSQVILNEWNAVSGGKFLDNGSSDLTFGRVAGNGGDWFEMVVVDPAGVDMRGWTFELSDTNNGASLRTVTDTFIASQISQLANVPAGTIVTVAQSVPDDFNLTDRHMNLQANAADAGSGFTAVSQSNFDTNSSDWQLVIRNAAGGLVFGPAGEGVFDFGNVSSSEVGKLEARPNMNANPLSNYNDGSTSTFGKPNVWSSSTAVQNFEDFWGPNPGVSIRPTDCSSGTGIIRIDITNNYAVSTNFAATIIGQLTNYVDTKPLTVAPGDTQFIGFSGRPDELYNVSVAAEGAPVVTLSGFDNATPIGTVVHCGPDDATVVANTCVSGAGRIYYSLRNDTAAVREYRMRVWYETAVIDDQAETNFGGIERIRTLQPGENRVEVVSGRTQDIGVLMTARQGSPGFAWNGAEAAGDSAVLVDCQGEPAEVGVLVSCLLFNGRIDIFLRRPAGEDSQYRVRVNGPNGFTTTRFVDLIDEETGRATVTGRPDGTYPIVVDKLTGGVWVPLPVDPAAVVVSCDQVPSIDATVRTTCLGGNGRIDVVLGNTSPQSAQFVVTVTSGSITPRSRTVLGEARSTDTYTGRPDGQIPVSVTKDGVTVFTDTVTIACD